MNQKFRPSLSAFDISHIISLLKSDASAQSLTIARNLAVFEAKIVNGVVGPSHLVEGRMKLEDSLGMGEINESRMPPHNEASKEWIKQTAYMKFQSNPTQCNLLEIKLAQEYKYENGLMTPEEEKQYERDIFDL